MVLNEVEDEDEEALIHSKRLHEGAVLFLPLSMHHGLRIPSCLHRWAMALRSKTVSKRYVKPGALRCTRILDTQFDHDLTSLSSHSSRRNANGKEQMPLHVATSQTRTSHVP